MPFVDESGKTIDSIETWNRSRNQQRNWETVNQIISLRTLPENISDPVKENNIWKFLFEIANIESVAWGADPVGALRFDSTNVPMIVGLTESQIDSSMLNAYGDEANIWFDIDDGK